jgi:hypothetical protein
LASSSDFVAEMVNNVVELDFSFRSVSLSHFSFTDSCWKIYHNKLSYINEKFRNNVEIWVLNQLTMVELVNIQARSIRQNIRKNNTPSPENVLQTNHGKIKI